MSASVQGSNTVQLGRFGEAPRQDATNRDRTASQSGSHRAAGVSGRWRDSCLDRAPWAGIGSRLVAGRPVAGSLLPPEALTTMKPPYGGRLRGIFSRRLGQRGGGPKHRPGENGPRGAAGGEPRPHGIPGPGSDSVGQRTRRRQPRQEGEGAIPGNRGEGKAARLPPPISESNPDFSTFVLPSGFRSAASISLAPRPYAR